MRRVPSIFRCVARIQQLPRRTCTTRWHSSMRGTTFLGRSNSTRMKMAASSAPHERYALVRFSGSAEERLQLLFWGIANRGCMYGKESQKSLYPFMKAIYDEGRAIAETDGQRGTVRNHRDHGGRRCPRGRHELALRRSRRPSLHQGAHAMITRIFMARRARRRLRRDGLRAGDARIPDPAGLCRLRFRERTR